MMLPSETGCPTRKKKKKKKGNFFFYLTGTDWIIKSFHFIMEAYLNVSQAEDFASSQSITMVTINKICIYLMLILP